MGIRIKEAEKFGIKKLITAEQSPSTNTIKKYGCKNIYQLLALFPEETPEKQPSTQKSI
jgi:hypothetical protein